MAKWDIAYYVHFLLCSQCFLSTAADASKFKASMRGMDLNNRVYCESIGMEKNIVAKREIAQYLPQCFQTSYVAEGLKCGCKSKFKEIYQWVIILWIHGEFNNQVTELFYWGFTPLLTLFQLYHGNSSLIHDPWVNKPVLG